MAPEQSMQRVLVPAPACNHQEDHLRQQSVEEIRMDVRGTSVWQDVAVYDP